jgi:septum formation protein
MGYTKRTYMNPWQYAPILLASQSPRRRQLLDEAGFSYRIHATHADESYPEDMPVEAVAEYLALRKLDAALALARPEEVILTADSVVILDGKIYGKPEDRQAAIDTLQQLQGRTHTVITGLAMSRGAARWSGSDQTAVTLGPMSYDEMAWYVDTYQPFDKAGAYGVQEWIGMCKITRLEGTYSNVMGLPTHMVFDVFRTRKI